VRFKEITEKSTVLFLNTEIDQFTLEIMEHCSPNTEIEREQFYLDNLKPFYNILTIAGNRSGFKHSEYTKELQRAHKLGYKVSDEIKNV